MVRSNLFLLNSYKKSGSIFTAKDNRPLYLKSLFHHKDRRAIWGRGAAAMICRKQGGKCSRWNNRKDITPTFTTLRAKFVYTGSYQTCPRNRSTEDSSSGNTGRTRIFTKNGSLCSANHVRNTHQFSHPGCRNL